jgi:hypothetical protein
LARPERFELPTSWFVAIGHNAKHAKPCSLYYKNQMVDRE